MNGCFGTWLGVKNNGRSDRPPQSRRRGLLRLDFFDDHVKVRIADSRSRLSEHLRHVRGGRTLTVLDRSTPIAQIVPHGDNKASLGVRSPIPRDLKLHRVPLASSPQMAKGRRQPPPGRPRAWAMIVYRDSSVLPRVVLGQRNAAKEWRAVEWGIFQPWSKSNICARWTDCG